MKTNSTVEAMRVQADTSEGNVRNETPRMNVKLMSDNKIKKHQGQYRITPRVAAALLAYYRPHRTVEMNEERFTAAIHHPRMKLVQPRTARREQEAS